MSESTARFALPFILPGQAQKEIYHNEALSMLDMIVAAGVEAGPRSAPPQSPLPGQCWLVAAGATGAWLGHDHHVAGWTEGGWRFVIPRPGMHIWCVSTGYWLYWTGQQWSSGELPVARLMVGGQQVVGSRVPAIPTPAGGTMIDVEARAALATIIAALMSHGLTG